MPAHIFLNLLKKKKKSFCFHGDSRSLTPYKLELFRSISKYFQVEVEEMKRNVRQQEAQPRLLVLLCCCYIQGQVGNSLLQDHLQIWPHLLLLLKRMGVFYWHKPAMSELHKSAMSSCAAKRRTFTVNIVLVNRSG